MNRAKMKLVAIGTGAAGLGAVVVLTLATTSEVVQRTERAVQRTERAVHRTEGTRAEPARASLAPAAIARSVTAPAASATPHEHEHAAVVAPRAATPVRAALAGLRSALERDALDDYEQLVEALRASLHDATPEEVAALLAVFRKTDDAALLGAIADALDPAGLVRPEVRAALLEMAEGDSSIARRTTALTALGHAATDDATIDRIARIAQDDRESEVRASAASALGSMLDGDPARGPRVNRALVDLALRDRDESVRAAALWSVRAHEADTATVERLSEVLAREDKLAPRQAAAEALAEVAPEHRARAVATLVQAIAQDRDIDVRKTELSAIVRAGRTDAIATLEAVAKNHPELAADAREWLVPLRRGEIDMDRIWEEKSRLEEARRASSPESHDHDHEAD